MMWSKLGQYETERIRQSLRTLILDWNRNVQRLLSLGSTQEEAERIVSDSLTKLLNKK